MMPWDFWGPGRDFRPDTDIPPDRLDRLDSLAADLAADRDPASIVVAHPWAALTPTILSFPEGKPMEISLAAS